MKKINLIQIVFIFVLMNLCYNGYGQFSNGTLTENAAGVTVQSRATGNDVLDLGGNTYRVSVYDDPINNTPGFSYRVTYSSTLYTGNLSFGQSNNVVDPDVCLVSDGSGKVYAIVVYYWGDVMTPNFYWEIFTWTTGGTPAFVLTSSNMFSGSYSTAVNIDGNENGDFVIIWDNNSSTTLKLLSGFTSSGNLPTLNNLGASVTYIPSDLHQYPDVCIYYRNSGGITNHVNISYVDGNGDVQVDYDLFSNVAINNLSFAGVMSMTVSGGYIFSEPRIACPNSAGLASDMTVVATESNGTVYRIKGITTYNGTTGSVITYNDYSGNSPADLTADFNLHPAVAYDSRTAYKVWIGWTFDDSGGASGTVAALPIVLKCNIDGTIPGGATYLEVPTSLTTNDAYDFLSLSGRYSSTTSGSEMVFLTYHFITNTDIITKERTSLGASTTLRLVNNNPHYFLSNVKSELLKQNDGDQTLLLNIFDVSGRKTLFKKGKIDDISKALEEYAKEGALSICVAQVIAENGKHNFSEKLITGK